MECPRCKSTVLDDAIICAQCGAFLYQERTRTSPTTAPTTHNRLRSYFIFSGIFTILPIPAYILTLVLSWLLGCDFSEAAVPECRILGLNIGELLYSLFMVAAWGWIVTLPAGTVLLCIGAVVAAFKERARRREQVQAQTNSASDEKMENEDHGHM